MSLRKVLVVTLAVVPLVAAGFAYSAAGEAPKKLRLASAHVYGGGQFGPGCFDGPGTLCFAKPRDFSIDAHRLGGVVSGTLTYGYGIFWRGRITCMTVTGNRAALGGVLADAPDGSGIGSPFLVNVVDNGPPGSPEDRFSALWVQGPGETFPGQPPGFPYVCPTSPDSWYGYQDLSGGDVVVQGG